MENPDRENRTHVIERLAYASASAQSARHNRCGRLLRHDDPAGTRHMTEYGLAGGTLEESQQFLRSLDLPHWPEPEAQAVDEAEAQNPDIRVPANVLQCLVASVSGLCAKFCAYFTARIRSRPWTMNAHRRLGRSVARAFFERSGAG